MVIDQKVTHQAVLWEPQAGTKVPQPDVSISCQQDVVRLDISGRSNGGAVSLPEDSRATGTDRSVPGFKANAVPVHVAQFVDRVDGQDHLSQVELSHVLREPVTKLTEQSQQVAPYIIVHYQILK